MNSLRILPWPECQHRAGKLCYRTHRNCFAVLNFHGLHCVSMAEIVRKADQDLPSCSARGLHGGNAAAPIGDSSHGCSKTVDIEPGAAVGTRKHPLAGISIILHGCPREKRRNSFSRAAASQYSSKEVARRAEECSQVLINLPGVITGAALHSGRRNGAAAQRSRQINNKLWRVDLQPAPKITRPGTLMSNRKSLPGPPLA